ncbi:MAG TPA: substrate-binding domain-containing protein [Sphingobacterium bovisgrunnientis]|jgi:phosphate transport system substrate-binding protein|uniref:PstS family phosphate ABC transporter substrate-binding protein n=1 Tax=Sphingobacterium bovisgrunnientis TaxID=1874697 RepID=UPI00135C99DE|nr:substrate-binding domain-containing protein [Sphingobacterium bovisgrunnientis]HLS37554.1 substrate-binding domain-containing protein [Sphingobacterium bovisgrunnientis]
MNLFYKIIYVFSAFLFLISCVENKEKKNKTDDILSGEIAVLVDESLMPIAVEQKEVFESSYYNAKINLIGKPEVQAVNDLIKGESGMLILSRELTEEEKKSFDQRSITPRIYPFAYDAVVLVGSSDIDSTIATQDIIDLMAGRNTTGKKLVIDNPNSSLVRYFRELGKLDKIANNYLEVKGNATEILNTVAANDKKIGLLSFNQYLSLQRSFTEKDKIRILSVLNDTLETPKYVKPSQASLSTGEYPLRREVKVLNYQPNMGLGMGFSAFVTGDRGQRIVLKSGLLPAKMPGREIIIRDNIN